MALPAIAPAAASSAGRLPNLAALCPWALAAATAGLLILAFPPFNLSRLALIALAPLLWAIVVVERSTTATLLGWLAGALFYYGTSWWATYSLIAYGQIPTLAAHLLIFIAAWIAALPTALFAWGAHLATRRDAALGWWLVPAWWCASECIRGEVLAFGWNPLANAVAFEPWLARAAALGGHRLVGAMLAAAATGVAYAGWSRRHPRRAAAGLVAAALALAVPALAAAALTPPASAESAASAMAALTVVAAQPCAPQGAARADEYACAYARQRALAAEGLRQASPETVRLVAFPESQLAPDLSAPNAEADFLPLLGAGAYVLTNATRPVGDGFANAAVLYAPNGRLAEYQKTHLMPFGEYVPLGRYLPFKLPTLATEAVPGARVETLPMNADIRLGVGICFESTFPSLHRTFRRQGANVLVNLANDGWFGPTPGSEQHLRHLVYRAIETGCPIVRVTNDGVSALLDANGRLRDVIPKNQPDARAWTVAPASPETTPYVVAGDWFEWSCLAAVGGALLWTLWRRIRFYAGAVADLVAGE
ncbi:MAG: apolipoprotein N-acyltransferase [Chloracidobacterium sp. CP2_5A]|nr:MAG: apolipoprotein N-acyltransferase [Chloracidobacterium sp. CP2_5A]